jgi:hypothetical protein
MVDTQGLGPCALKKRGGSSPLIRTICYLIMEQDRRIPSDIRKIWKYEALIKTLGENENSPRHIEELRDQAIRNRDVVREELKERLLKEEGVIK